MTGQDRRFILVELEGRAAGERLVLVRAALERFVRETGEPLRQQRYERWRVALVDADVLPSAAFVADTWNGSWGNAMDELGIQAAPDQLARLMLLRGVSPTDTELLEVLRACATEFGRTPTLRDFRLWKREVSRRTGGPVVFSQQTYHEHFGGWLHALDAVEIEDALGRFAHETSGSVSSCAYERWQRQATSGPGARPPGRKILTARHGGWAPVAGRIRAQRLTTAGSGNRGRACSRRRLRGSYRGVTTADTHMRPAEERSSLTTDPLTLNLFRQLRSCARWTIATAASCCGS